MNISINAQIKRKFTIYILSVIKLIYKLNTKLLVEV